MPETEHIWVDGPHGKKYHCQNCGISKTNDYSFFDTCELWTNRVNAYHARLKAHDEVLHKQTSAIEKENMDLKAQVAALTAERDSWADEARDAYDR